jgi:uncharacterized membrane protein
MNLSIVQLAWLFILYSFVGWCISVAFCAVKKRSFVNPGFLSLPLCPIYGTGAVLSTIFLPELVKRPVFFILGAGILSGILMVVTGAFLEKILHRKWWDFSGHRFHLLGYTSLPLMLVFGAAAWVCVRLFNPLFTLMLGDLPPLLSRILLLVILGCVAIDAAVSFGLTLGVRFRLKKLSKLSHDFKELSSLFGNAITKRMLKRLVHAYPHLEDSSSAVTKEQPSVFAAGCSLTKLIWLFVIAALLGDLIETIFCRLTAGVWMSRSSLIYGPFSVVWGLGAVMFTSLLYRYRNKSEGYLFVAGTVLGGAYEYFCSVFTELVFGTVFWDYSEIPFNLAGRINLLYCFFWGIAAVAWMKLCYPRLSRWIERIPKNVGRICTVLLVVFMVLNILISGIALARYEQRHSTPAAPQNVFSDFLDEHYPDERMERIYPNAILVEPSEPEPPAVG